MNQLPSLDSTNLDRWHLPAAPTSTHHGKVLCFNIILSDGLSATAPNGLNCNHHLKPSYHAKVHSGSYHSNHQPLVAILCNVRKRAESDVFLLIKCGLHSLQ